MGAAYIILLFLYLHLVLSFFSFSSTHHIRVFSYMVPRGTVHIDYDIIRACAVPFKHLIGKTSRWKISVFCYFWTQFYEGQSPRRRSRFSSRPLIIFLRYFLLLLSFIDSALSFIPVFLSPQPSLLFSFSTFTLRIRIWLRHWRDKYTLDSGWGT